MWGFSYDQLKGWAWAIWLYVLSKFGYVVGLVAAVCSAGVIWFTSGTEAILEYVWNLFIPTNSSWNWSQVLSAYKAANEWLPVKEWFTAVISTWAAQAAMIGTRFFLKLFSWR